MHHPDSSAPTVRNTLPSDCDHLQRFCMPVLYLRRRHHCHVVVGTGVGGVDRDEAAECRTDAAAAIAVWHAAGGDAIKRQAWQWRRSGGHRRGCRRAGSRCGGCRSRRRHCGGRCGGRCCWCCCWCCCWRARGRRRGASCWSAGGGCSSWRRGGWGCGRRGCRGVVGEPQIVLS